MDLPQLRCFLAVAEELHFGKAAARLHLTPSPVSRMIKSLERELGGDLFVRMHHDVQLTHLGERIVEHVRTIVWETDRLPRLAASALAQDRVMRTGASYLIPPSLTERFLDLTESVMGSGSVESIIGLSSVLVPDVVDGALDVAMVHLPVVDPRLDSLMLSAYEFFVAMRADDELAARPEVTMKDLVSRTVVVGPPTPHPLAVNSHHHRLAEEGITRFHQMGALDNVQYAAYIRRHGAVTVTTNPAHGGFASVFLHPSFAAVPLRGDLRFEVGVTWNRARHAEDPVLQKLVQALRDDRDGFTPS
ncbi:LysR family transcriptional regulator [Pseudonocardia halophobica]|uniref:Transcriptional regulator n=1 Tax=Pseudonocardia halophobica TaxID=29401 RepID=A0A9W6L3P7_9PSEU|nr:LysR family transcriptional regulator [Pseudonocardia halophobica]GLL10509.1 transcriptional regulator [Pseudonocardia halophobica]